MILKALLYTKDKLSEYYSYIRYRKSLEKYVIPYEKRYSDTRLSSYSISSVAPKRTLITSLDVILEVRDHQDKFPILTSLARDALSIPTTSSRVKRLFNSARDIYHYRRAREEKDTQKEKDEFNLISDGEDNPLDTRSQHL
ncbi:uncharacterized protein N7496_004503 [Penicillium cataractarum]|uniref:HAT C-terminal dimerisation domain-containing protein n=1 Tax=Penicillium cataractarum TaxID=2100454 RepID=A0A9W9VJU8_9EURO|nr:uncharacterized protein N7496_004503 [Penicillium cataractarum]KAJ5382075.1 hypothetical protein N7496_004503 [Penicillium cataractarum]